MSSDINIVTFNGRFTQELELKHTTSGMAVLEAPMAINREWGKGEEKKKETAFVDVTFWGGKAEVVSKYCKKGKPLFIVGHLKTDMWENKEDGKKRSKLKVICDDFKFMDIRPDKENKEESGPDPWDT